MKNFTKGISTGKIVSVCGVGTIQYSLCLLAAVLVLNTTSVAQQQNNGAYRRSIQSSANSGNTSSNYTVTKQNGELILSDGKSETVVSNDATIRSPLVHGDDIKTKKTEDIILPNSSTASYDSKNVLENLLQDNNSGKLYFSTSSKNRRGHTEFLTWTYDINLKNLTVYRDGRIECIDALGNQTIVFEGFDSKGKFTSRTLVGTDGNTIKELGKEYVAQTIK